MKKIKLYKILLAAFVLVIAGVFYTFVFADDESDKSEIRTLSSEDETENEADISLESIESARESELICVHVCGEVISDGVYYLEEGSRINDAIAAAGGFSEGAAKSYLNLAAYAVDGMQIYVPSLDEDESDLTGVVPSADDEDTDNLININTATAEELTALSGIGDTKAAAIVSYRENYGNFNSIEEIMNVSGIGESSFERIKDQIRI